MAKDDSFGSIAFLVAFLYAIVAEAVSLYMWFTYMEENAQASALYAALVGHVKGWLWVFFVW